MPLAAHSVTAPASQLTAAYVHWSCALHQRGTAAPCLCQKPFISSFAVPTPSLPPNHHRYTRQHGQDHENTKTSERPPIICCINKWLDGEGDGKIDQRRADCQHYHQFARNLHTSHHQQGGEIEAAAWEKLNAKNEKKEKASDNSPHQSIPLHTWWPDLSWKPAAQSSSTALQQSPSNAHRR